MPSIKETIEHLRQVSSTRGGKMTTIILLISGAILGGIMIGLNMGAIKPLEGLGQTLVTILIFIFVFSFAFAIYLLIPSNQPKKLIKQRDIEDEYHSTVTDVNLLRIWSRRISLGGILLIGLVVYILGWFFVIKYLGLPAIHQIASGTILWEMGTAPNSIGNLVVSFMMFIIWLIMPFMLYMDFNKKQQDNNAKGNKMK